MKEFLVNHDDKWTLQLLDADTEENSFRVAVPSGADSARCCDGFIEFYKNDFSMFFSLYCNIWKPTISNKKVLLQNIVWQRHETKEFLNSKTGYVLQVLPAHAGDDPESGLIEVPEGADVAILEKGMNKPEFINTLKNKVFNAGDWFDLGDSFNLDDYIRKMICINVVWKRHTQPKELKHRVGVDATLAERQATYGSFEDVAFVTENVMSVLSKARPNGLGDLPHTHRMALYMIASKMARIVNGNFNHLDSWHDIGGYAKLIENLIGGEDE